VPAALPADGVLLLDKPPGFSSTQALGRAKRLLGARKAGHTGTLDPFATGLLPIVFGEATKFSRFLIDAPKGYLATLRLGATSSTGDPEGDVSIGPSFAGDAGKIDEVLAAFRGVQEQVPPMHSAVRIGGRRLYDLAREGVEVDRAARAIEIHALERVLLEGDTLRLAVECSKGTYVRTLAMEIGAALGCGAYLTALRRTTVADFSIEDAVTLELLAELPRAEALRRLLPPEALVRGLPRLEADPPSALSFTQGQVLECPGRKTGEDVAVFGPGSAFLGVGRVEVEGRLSPLRLMATGEAAKLPDFP
jgi:tRNA pseudouridine55 synthase